MLPEKQREADANRESFADLAKEVRLYKEKIQSAVTRAETRLVQDIQNAENQKSQIKKDIERYVSFPIVVGANAADGSVVFACRLEDEVRPPSQRAITLRAVRLC